MNSNLTTPGTSGEAAEAPGADIRHLSIQQLAQLGVAQVAYVRPVVMNGALGFAIHAADGTPMAVAAEQETALEAIRQHDMLPMLLH